MTTPTTDAIMALADRYAFHIPGSQHSDEARAVLLAALQARNQQGPIKTWQERLEETCPALGPMHIHACVEEVNDAMQAEIDALRAAMQAREGEAVAWSDDALNRAYSDGVAYGERNYRQAIATYQAEASGYKDAYFKLVESIANLKVFEPAPPIIIAAPQPAQPTLKWCDQCGEGVTDFCRGKGGKCAYGFKPAGQPAQPEQGERPASKAELLKNLTQWLDGLGLEIHTYSLRGIALHGFEKGWDAALQSAQPVALPQRCPLCNYQHGHAIGCENNPVDIALKAKAAHGIGGAL